MALNEVKVLSQMDHPNIVAYHDSFEKDGILMIEMEYADGGNLQEFLAKQDRFAFLFSDCYATYNYFWIS